jgi:hypothetical protein
LLFSLWVLSVGIYLKVRCLQGEEVPGDEGYSQGISEYALLAETFIQTSSQGISSVVVLPPTS